MKRILFLLVISSTLLFSCGDNKIPEGEIEYEITYPYSNVSGFMEAILPKSATLTFKGTKMMTHIVRGTIFETYVISDEADHSVEMRLDFGDKFYYTQLTKEDIEDLKTSQPDYKLTATSKEDSVQGMWAKEYTVESGDTINHTNSWFTEDLKPQEGYFYSSYRTIKGVPVIYDVERYGIIMHLEAVKFTKREVLESEFERDPALMKIDFKEYESEVQELFDILMN